LLADESVKRDGISVYEGLFQNAIRQVDLGSIRVAKQWKFDPFSWTTGHDRHPQLRGDGPREQAFQRFAALGRTRLGGAHQLRRQFDRGAHKSIKAYRKPHCQKTGWLPSSLFLEQLVPTAIRIAVGSGEKQTQDMKVAK
jgi:hypothetical protein